MTRSSRSCFLAAGAIVWSLTNSAFAEIVRVQTGEHAAFTRIAMVFESPTKWHAGTTQDGFGLALKRSGISFDLSGSFELIPRDRLQDIVWNADEQVLALKSECECHLVAFELPGNTLVLDVFSGPSPEGNLFARPLFETDARTVEEDSGTPAPNTGTFRSETLAKRLPSVFQKRPTPFPLIEAPKTVPDFTIFEQALVNAVGNAARQGLVSIGNDARLPQPEGSENPRNSEVSLPLSGNPAAHLRTNRGLGESNVQNQNALENTYQSCLEREQIDVASWGKGTPQQVMADARLSIFDDLGQIDTAAVITAARLQIYLGFGAEALNFLNLLEARTQETDILRDLAEIIDSTPNKETRLVHHGLKCPSAAALWALLAIPADRSRTEVDGSAVQQSFGQLPMHLQKLVGLNVVRALRGANKAEEAEAVLAMLQRLPGPPPTELASLIGQDRLASGEISAGEAALGTAIRADTEATPGALLNLLEAREKRSETVPEDIIILAESIAQEARGTEISQDLLIAAAKAHARDGRFEAAFEHLNTLEGAGNTAAAALRSDLADKLADIAPDNLFLLAAFREGLMLPDAELMPGTAINIANRLLTLGFLAEADALAESIEEAVDGLMLLKARLSKARGKPNLALDQLSNLTDDDAVSLRAEILSDVGNQTLAAETFTGLGQVKQAADAAWRSGNPELIIELGAPEQRAFVNSIQPDGAVSLSQTAETAVSDLSQENLRALLDGTTTFREAAQSLLSKEPIINQ